MARCAPAVSGVEVTKDTRPGRLYLDRGGGGAALTPPQPHNILPEMSGEPDGERWRSYVPTDSNRRRVPSARRGVTTTRKKRSRESPGARNPIGGEEADA